MWVFLRIFLKNWRAKSVHGRIPWAQNSGNPCTKLIISLFSLYMCFFVFWKSMKNDDFRSSFGRAPVVVLVIFIKFQGGYLLMINIWSGRFGSAPVVVLVIFKVARRRLWHWLAIVLWTPKVHCGGKGVNKERRKWVITRDLTRPGPRPGEFFSFVLCVVLEPLARG